MISYGWNQLKLGNRLALCMRQTITKFQMEPSIEAKLSACRPKLEFDVAFGLVQTLVSDGRL